jgi:hypothetical protein
MAIEVDTKDTTALSDAELAEMAEMDGEESAFDIGVVSKERESWVLITQARYDGRLYGFAFSTLERIGGTPSVILGLASIKRSSRRDSVLRAVVGEQLRRAVLAFPDEDVLIGVRLSRPDGIKALDALQDLIPRPDHRANGEERAWGRRLVKRWGLDGDYDDRGFQTSGIGAPIPVLDYEALEDDETPPEIAAFFEGVDVADGGCVVMHGWAMSEDLAKLLD